MDCVASGLSHRVASFVKPSNVGHDECICGNNHGFGLTIEVFELTFVDAEATFGVISVSPRFECIQGNLVGFRVFPGESAGTR